jgi:UDP-N-acetylglucosamine 2-epimerase (non-hydrolysing)
MACALAAVKLGIPVAHVEAGLRSFDRTMPEEINRLVTDAVSDVLLVSEPSGEMNLRREGIPEERIRFVGNVMIDTLVRELPAARELGMPARLGLRERHFALITLHRPSNVDSPDRLRELVVFLRALSETLPVVFPVHPRTWECLERFELLPCLKSQPAIRVMKPLGYQENLSLMAAARFVITDSGGMQEETSFLRIPCLTFRPNTERPVTVSEGTNTVVGADLALADRLVEEILRGRYKTGQPIQGWDGHAAERVVRALVERW